MDGVTILNAYSEWRGGAAAILFCVFIICLSGVIGGASMAILECRLKDVICGVLLTIVSLFVLVGAFAIMPKTECIQVTIDDTVSWVELTDKYEIIKSDGRIITMIEKEQQRKKHKRREKRNNADLQDR